MATSPLFPDNGTRIGRDPMLSEISYALWEQDPELALHGSRVARIACDLGELIEFNGLRMAQLRMASVLHDVGKLHIPLGIIRKPGPLSPEEWVCMKQHPELGFDLLAGYVDPVVAEAVLAHHERYDGHGYPHRRREGQTPLIARVLQVADAFDAIITERCYQPALPVDFALRELDLNAGTQFDPAVVAAMMTLATDELWVDSLDLMDLAFAAA
jgi:HD-GYP domain-containing protein (c-di-GMP phosphodiesterase class II)